jgi:hypothetical protein
MATLDEILGGSPPNGGGHAPKGSQEWAEQNSGNNAGGSGGSTPPKGSQEWAEQNSGDNAPVSSSPTAPTQPGAKSKPSSGAGAPASGGGGGGYEELFKKLNPYTPPTAEELEKERKREKRAQIIAAIGDGITALSNLFFTTQYAPNMYDGKNTISQANKVRYDKLIKDREEKNTAYFNGLMRARQADDENAHRERSWQRQLGLDQEARDRYNESITHRNEREQIADDRYDSEQAYRRGRDEEADRRWQANFDEDKRRSDRSYNFQVRQHNDNVAVRREQARATAARGVRGKQLGFADGNGNQVSIYENVWKGSMQQVYDAMLSDLAPADEAERKRWERQMKKLDTPQKKEDYVKQNWHKSPKASQIMLTLSGIDPATMTSELNDDVEDYTPGGGDDKVIDYTPGNK